MKARSSSHDVAADGVISSKKNSQVKVKKKKKMEREHSGFLSVVTGGTWSCVAALDM